MWCPVCKTEYQEGITVCAECGSYLVEGTEDDFLTTCLCELKDKEAARKLIEYLQFSGIEKAEEKEAEGVYTITVPERQAKQAEKLMRGFMLALQEEQDKVPDIEETSSVQMESEKGAEGDYTEKGKEEPQEGILYNSSKTYTKKADEYKDVKFSGITFIIFGLIGIAYLTLCKFGIIPLTYNDIVLACLLCMFAFIIIGGVVSVIKSGKIKGQISEEEAMTKEIKLWLGDSITEETVGNWKDANASDEENELFIISGIGRMLLENYPQLDIAYLEMVADEYFNENLSGNI